MKEIIRVVNDSRKSSTTQNEALKFFKNQKIKSNSSTI